MQVWIGTSGYSYRDWVGGFYPRGTTARRMLSYYAGHFPIVELNFTFYHSPTPAMLARLAEQTPAGFQFIVKLPQSLSHEERTDDLDGFRRAVEELQQRGRLEELLCQLPQSCHNVPERRRWIELLGTELGAFRLGVEFRHRSWQHSDVAEWLKQRKLDLVAVDVPEIPALFPRGLVYNGPRAYVRFHSRNAENWYRSDKDRYDFDYPDAALRDWVEAVTTERERLERVLLLFNNCHRSHAAENARRMGELFAEAAPDVDVISPFASTHEAAQRLLFE
jgi:uncharacterized protein YecE (DUF72 family)